MSKQSLVLQQQNKTFPTCIIGLCALTSLWLHSISIRGILTRSKSKQLNRVYWNNKETCLKQDLELLSDLSLRKMYGTKSTAKYISSSKLKPSPSIRFFTAIRDGRCSITIHCGRIGYAACPNWTVALNRVDRINCNDKHTPGSTPHPTELVEQ